MAVTTHLLRLMHAWMLQLKFGFMIPAQCSKHPFFDNTRTHTPLMHVGSSYGAGRLSI